MICFGIQNVLDSKGCRYKNTTALLLVAFPASLPCEMRPALAGGGLDFYKD